MAIQEAAVNRSRCGVYRAVPFVHVADVQAALDFYVLLGFVPERVLKDGHEKAYWALVRSGKAEMMFARGSGPIDPEQQAVLFYMYSENVAELRQRLLRNGLRDGGRYSGAKSAKDGPRVVFDVAHPDYMDAGELRMTDPDGYVILVGQLG